MDADRISAAERAEIKELFREQIAEWISPEALEDPVEIELLTAHALLHFQDGAAPEGVAEDAVAVLEERGDAAGASLLAVAGLLLAPSLAEPARAALGRLRAAGIEAELPAGTGELEVALARRLDGERGDLYVASLSRGGEEPEQQALIGIERTEAGPLLVAGGIGRGVEELEIEGEQAVNVSADELHAAIAEALALGAELGLPVPHELGVALPMIWRAVGGEPAGLEGLHLGLPGEEIAPEAAELDWFGEAPTPPSQALPYLKLDAPRNASCPCGSGRKAKRCCLPRSEGLRREAAALEDLAAELGERAFAHCPRCLEDAFAELFHSSAWFGFETAAADVRLEAALWIACDGKLCEGLPPPLGRVAEDGGPDPEQGAWAEALGGSRTRAWRVERVGEAGLLDAVCPLSGERAQLELVRAPMGEPEPGRLLVARSLPRPEGRFALLGMAPVVVPEAQAEFEALLERVRADAESADEAWRLHGGELLRAAWCWPEEHLHTVEGDPVEEHHVALALPDREAAVAALRADPEMQAGGLSDDEVLTWDWRGQPRAPEPAAMPQRPGVRWRLCDEDSADPPLLAMLELRVEDEELWIFAPTEARLGEAEALLRGRFTGLLGEELERDHEGPDVIRRWQRERVGAAA